MYYHSYNLLLNTGHDHFDNNLSSSLELTHSNISLLQDGPAVDASHGTSNGIQPHVRTTTNVGERINGYRLRGEWCLNGGGKEVLRSGW